MTSPTPSAQPPESDYADRAFRSPLGIAGGVFLVLLAVFFGVDVMLNGHGNSPWIALAGLILAIPLIIAFTIRPVVQAGEERLRVRNPFRTLTLPWGEVADIRAGYSSEVFTQAGRKYQLWAVPVSLRQRKRAARRAARASQDDPHGRTSVSASVTDRDSRVAPADQTIADLREMAERLGGRPEAQGEVQVRWAYEVIAPAVVGLVLWVILAAMS
ncbi:PH domain-containing protein [Streptomyces sp. NPDC048717]|uniref:PH domain-containing protein n=1 Tax=unclassified Streptomyces TaxID=2593676 RepID=UPI003418522F